MTDLEVITIINSLDNEVKQALFRAIRKLAEKHFEGAAIEDYSKDIYELLEVKGNPYN